MICRGRVDILERLCDTEQSVSLGESFLSKFTRSLQFGFEPIEQDKSFRNLRLSGRHAFHSHFDARVQFVQVRHAIRNSAI